MKTFVEIGTCDFWTLRHLCDDGWRGVMVEPHKPFLDSIPDHPNLIKVNKAMDITSGIATYTKIKDSDMFDDPDYEPYGINLYRGMGTIYHGNVLHVSDIYKGHLESYQVPTITFDDLMEELGIKTIDYLKIDTEGSDFPIFESIDFNKYKINVLKMETGYCDPDVVADILYDLGYHTEFFENDVMSFKL
jgi:FkbM family methyltransferase